MPTYDYQCRACGHRFEIEQKISETPLKVCPQCQGELARLLSGGSGFILKTGGNHPSDNRTNHCSFEQTGRTCCGREQRCESSQCEKD